MNCKATKTLMDIASECFASMIGVTSPDACVDALLEASVKYSPHFDWVVAHIGSSFPTTIITRVLMCGLKDFCSHGTSQSAFSDEKIPKMASVVGILSHLAGRHGNDIKKALLNLFEESLSANPSNLQSSIIPYLLHLASMSSLLLRVIATELVNNLTPCTLNKLVLQYPHWERSSRQDRQSLLSLTVHLLMKCNDGAFQVMDFLLKTAAGDDTTQSNMVVQKCCDTIMDHLLLELQRIINSRSFDPGMEIHLLCSLQKNKDQICEQCLASNGKSCVWLTRLLSYIAVHAGDACACHILCYILHHAKPTQLEIFLEIQHAVETRYLDILSSTAAFISSTLQHNSKSTVICLRNLFALVQWEMTADGKRCARTKLRKHLQHQGAHLLPLLQSARDEISLVTLELLNLIGFPKNTRVDIVLKICASMVAFAFRILRSHDEALLLGMVSTCRSYIQKLSRLAAARNVLLRQLIEGAVSQENGYLFGARFVTTSDKSSVIEKPSSTLLNENNKPAIALVLPQSHLSVYHAGIIGKGLKSAATRPLLTMQQKSFNTQLLLDLIWLCWSDVQRSDNSSQSSMESEGSSSTSQLLVELVTPDVMYNSPYWPEEETIRQTIERDLFIRKRFDEHPFLWNVLEMIASSKTAIIECACLLRSIMASLLIFWDGCREKIASNASLQMKASCLVLDCLRKGKVVPAPLCFVGELLPPLAPHEVYLLLSTVWKFLQENPAQIDVENGGLSMTQDLNTKYLIAVQSIIHSNIDKLGGLSSRFLHT